MGKRLEDCLNIEGISLDDLMGIFSGTTDPADTVTSAPTGSMYIRSDGTHYYKEGGGNSATDWVILDIFSQPRLKSLMRPGIINNNYYFPDTHTGQVTLSSGIEGNQFFAFPYSSHYERVYDSIGLYTTGVPNALADFYLAIADDVDGFPGNILYETAQQNHATIGGRVFTVKDPSGSVVDLELGVGRYWLIYFGEYTGVLLNAYCMIATSSPGFYFGSSNAQGNIPGTGIKANVTYDGNKPSTKTMPSPSTWVIEDWYAQRPLLSLKA